MFHVFGSYYAQSDGGQIAVGEIREYTEGKTGERKRFLTNQKYYDTVEGMLKGTLKRLRLEALQGVEGELEEAVAAVQRVTDEFTKAITSITEEPKLEEVLELVRNQNAK